VGGKRLPFFSTEKKKLPSRTSGVGDSSFSILVKGQRTVKGKREGFYASTKGIFGPLGEGRGSLLS